MAVSGGPPASTGSGLSARARRVAWALVDASDAGSQVPMAVDEALLEAAIARGGDVAAVRFYRWAAPSLSVGAKQDVPAPVLEHCGAAGVEVVRRPTGGGAVLHRGDLTYAVVARDRGLGVLGIYRWVAEGLVAGFAALGLEASVVERRGADGGRALACFAVPTGADLEVGGRKICGSAQVRRSGWFLQHGSIPVGEVRAETAGLLGLAGPREPREAGEPGEAAGAGEPGDSTCVQTERPGSAWAEVAAAFESGFRAVWGDPCAQRTLDAAEQAVVSRLAAHPGPVLASLGSARRS